MNCTFLDDNKIVIGDNALIAPNVQIYTAFHPTNAVDRFGKPREDGSFEFCKTQTAPVVIGDHVWIGGGVIIMPGVTIGDNVVIGAGSVVTRDIPDNVIAYGNPCRVMRENGQKSYEIIRLTDRPWLKGKNVVSACPPSWRQTEATYGFTKSGGSPVTLTWKAWRRAWQERERSHNGIWQWRGIG